MRREVRVQDAIGMTLAHDLTRIVPGEFKGRAFAKGHVIREEDIPQLLSIGKEHIFVLELGADEVHEDEAAQLMANALAHSSLTMSAPHEGKVTFKAAHAGLWKVDVSALMRINSIIDLAVVTKRTDTPVVAGESVTGLRAIPLVLKRERLEQFLDVAKQDRPLLQVIPYRPLPVGIVTTGSEVAKGRITDRFGPVLQEKLELYGLQSLGQTIVGDSVDDIVAAIRGFLAAGAKLVLVTGGMSVDPDDRSPAAIREVATEVVTYGMPVLPGSMSMLAYAGDVPIMGLPGCVIYDAVTVFDWLLPRLAAGERIVREDIVALGHGGLIK
ncbi:MAG: molybdopterin-binding protein [Firmicutes bacterium]|nr:molybdopterin-binding protein [Bacillota bacterium]